MQAPAHSPPVGGKQTELRVRLRLLAERSPFSWTIKEMRATLKAGGVYVDQTMMEHQVLRRMTEALATAAEKQWEEQAEEEARVAAKKRMQAEASRKFRSRGRDEGFVFRKETVCSTADGDETSRSWISEDSSIVDGPSSARWHVEKTGGGESRPLSQRSATSSRSNHGTLADIQSQLRTLLVPEWAKNTLWSTTVDAVVRCAPMPHAVARR